MPANTGTTLLSLPDELLDQILAEVKWDALEPQFDLDSLGFDQNLTQNTADIQAVRLTCRRLAWRASPLLLPVASVAISDPSSIDSLEQIARHAALAPYVKAVRVRFDVYDAGLAADIRALAAYLCDAWLGSDLLWEAKWTRTFEHWRTFSLGAAPAGNGWDPVPDDVRNEWEASIQELERQHREYQRRYQAQYRLRPVVLGRIAAAMAAIPNATRLALTDGPDTPHKASHAARGAGAPWLVAPMNWENILRRCDYAPPIWMLLSLPVVVHRAGVSLTALRIHRIRIPARFPRRPSPDCDWDALALTRNQTTLPRALLDACASLRVLDFATHYEPKPGCVSAQADWSRVMKGSGPPARWDHVLEAMQIRSRQLVQLRVDFQTLHGVATYQGDSMLRPSFTWPLIRVLHLRDGPVEITNLRDLLASTVKTLVQLSLDGMSLYAGPVASTVPQTPYSWSLVLDHLRAHCCKHGLVAWVRAPRGAEFDDRSVRGRKHLLALFAPDGAGTSDVDRYVGGLADRNPIVEAGLTRRLYL